MATVSTTCSIYSNPLPYRTSGVLTRFRESDDCVSQSIECCICSTLIKIYFTEGTHEFQGNLGEPIDSALTVGKHYSRKLEAGDTVYLTKLPGRKWFVRSYDRSWIDGQILKNTTVFAETAGFASQKFFTQDEAYEFVRNLFAKTQNH